MMNALFLAAAVVASAQLPKPVYVLDRICSNADGTLTFTKEIVPPHCGIPGCEPIIAPLETWKVNGRAVPDAQIAALSYEHLGRDGERVLKTVTLKRAAGAAFASGATELSDVLICKVTRHAPPPPGAHRAGGR